MRIGAAFGSYLKADDLQGRPARVQMAGVKMEKIGQDDEQHKPVLYFQGKEKGLVLNKTNADTIAGIYGDETDYWAGQWIEIFPTTTMFGGKTVPALRVRPIAGAPGAYQPPPQGWQPPGAPPMPAGTQPAYNGTPAQHQAPHGWHPPAGGPPPAVPPPAGEGDYGAPIDDSIPF